MSIINIQDKNEIKNIFFVTFFRVEDGCYGSQVFVLFERGQVCPVWSFAEEEWAVFIRDVCH